MSGGGDQKVPAARVRKLDAFRGARSPGSYWVDGDYHTVIWYCCPCGCGAFGLTTLLNEDPPRDLCLPVRLPRWNGDLKSPSVEGAFRSPCGENLRLVAGVWIS